MCLTSRPYLSFSLMCYVLVLGSLNALSVFTSGSEHLRRAGMARSILRLTDRKQIAGQLLLCAMHHARLQRSEINTVKEPSVQLEDTSLTDGDGSDLFFLHFSFVGDGTKISLNCPDLIFTSF